MNASLHLPSAQARSPQALLDPPRVLFVGDDASSPEIAASVLRDLAGDRLTVGTAGTEISDPGGRSDEMLVAMGLNPAEERRLSARALYAADHVVVLGADLDVARLPGPRYEVWDLDQVDLVERVQALNVALTTRPVGAGGLPVGARLRERLAHIWRRLSRG